MNVWLMNRSATHAQTAWTPFTIPYTGKDFPDTATLTIDGKRWPVVRGRHLGTHSTVMHALVALAPSQVVAGVLDAAPMTVPPFTASAWVADDIKALVPDIHVRVLGNDHVLDNAKVVAIELSQATQVWRVYGRIPQTALYLTAYLTVGSGTDVIEVQGVIGNCDPTTSQIDQIVDEMWIETGEFFHLDYRGRLGLPEPEHVGAYRYRQHLITDQTIIGYGQQIPLYGALLCLPQSVPTGKALADPHHRTRVDTLAARMDGPIRALCRNWQNRWLAFGSIPTEIAGDFERATDLAVAVRDYFGSRGAGWFEPRRRGLMPRAGSTGAQEDFGACKGLELVTLGDLRFVDDMLFALTEPLRPIHYREGDLLLHVTKASHPEWFTFSQVTHYHAGMSPDRLGKPHPQPQSNAHGWEGKDDQHASSRNLEALYALTGSHLLEDWLRDEQQAAFANVYTTKLHTVVAARAFGRMLHNAANRALLLGGTEDIRHLETWVDLLADTWVGKAFVDDPERPCRVIITQTDNRLLRDPDGTAVPTIKIWEHGLAAVGMCAAFNVARRLGLDDVIAKLTPVLRETLRTICHVGFYEEGGVWQVATEVRYNDGKAIPREWYANGGREGFVRPGGRNWWHWTLPGLLWLPSSLEGGDLGLAHEDWDRINAILRYAHGLYPNEVPEDWGERQWWCV